MCSFLIFFFFICITYLLSGNIYLCIVLTVIYTVVNLLIFKKIPFNKPIQFSKFRTNASIADHNMVPECLWALVLELEIVVEQLKHDFVMAKNTLIKAISRTATINIIWERSEQQNTINNFDAIDTTRIFINNVLELLKKLNTLLESKYHKTTNYTYWNNKIHTITHMLNDYETDYHFYINKLKELLVNIKDNMSISEENPNKPIETLKASESKIEENNEQKQGQITILQSSIINTPIPEKCPNRTDKELAISASEINNNTEQQSIQTIGNKNSIANISNPDEDKNKTHEELKIDENEITENKEQLQIQTTINNNSINNTQILNSIKVLISYMNSSVAQLQNYGNVREAKNRLIVGISRPETIDIIWDRREQKNIIDNIYVINKLEPFVDNILDLLNRLYCLLSSNFRGCSDYLYCINQMFTTLYMLQHLVNKMVEINSQQKFQTNINSVDKSISNEKIQLQGALIISIEANTQPLRDLENVIEWPESVEESIRIYLDIYGGKALYRDNKDGFVRSLREKFNIDEKKTYQYIQNLVKSTLLPLDIQSAAICLEEDIVIEAHIFGAVISSLLRELEESIHDTYSDINTKLDLMDSDNFKTALFYDILYLAYLCGYSDGKIGKEVLWSITKFNNAIYDRLSPYNYNSYLEANMEFAQRHLRRTKQQSHKILSIPAFLRYFDQRYETDYYNSITLALFRFARLIIGTNKDGVGKQDYIIKQAHSLIFGETPIDSADNIYDNKITNAINNNLEQPSFDNMTGKEFEILIAKLLEQMGLNVSITKTTGDGGIDIIAISNKPLYEGKYVIQCKRWSNPVGEPVLRDLYGVVMSERANKGIIITNSTFTSGAIKFAAEKQLELIDGQKLKTLLDKYAVKK